MEFDGAGVEVLRRLARRRIVSDVAASTSAGVDRLARCFLFATDDVVEEIDCGQVLRPAQRFCHDR